MFIVAEIQTANCQTSVITTTFATLNEADNKYHTILAAAAISTVAVHAAIMYTATGSYIKSEYYKHDEVTE